MSHSWHCLEKVMLTFIFNLLSHFNNLLWLLAPHEHAVLSYSIFSWPWILKRSSLQVSTSLEYAQNTGSDLGSLLVSIAQKQLNTVVNSLEYIPHACGYSSASHYFACVCHLHWSAKSKKKWKTEKVMLFSYESSIPQNCLLDWQLSLLVIHPFKIVGGNYPVFPLGVKSYG